MSKIIAYEKHVQPVSVLLFSDTFIPYILGFSKTSELHWNKMTVKIEACTKFNPSFCTIEFLVFHYYYYILSYRLKEKVYICTSITWLLYEKKKKGEGANLKKDDH